MRSFYLIPLSVCLVFIVAGCAPLSTASGGGTSTTATAVPGAPTFAPLPSVPPATAQHIARITMTDPLNGWALTDPTTGASPAGLDVDANSRLLVTSDGGHHWSDVTPSYQPPTLAQQLAICFAARPHGRAVFVVQQPTSRAVAYFYTVDAGRTWKRLNIIDDGRGRLDSFTFIDDQRGFSVSRFVDVNDRDFVDVIMTNNFFHGIQAVPTTSAEPDFFRGSKVSLSFSDANTVWAAIPHPAALSGALRQSRDSGKTWQTVNNVPFPTSGGGQTTPLSPFTLTAPVWTDSRTGIIRLETNDSLFHAFVTTNGGDTWTVVPNSLPFSVAVRQFIAVDALHWWIVPQSSDSIYQTSDGGAHWTATKLGPFAYSTVYWLDALDATHGWAITSEGLWATTNNWQDWSLVQ